MHLFCYLQACWVWTCHICFTKAILVVIPVSLLIAKFLSDFLQQGAVSGSLRLRTEMWSSVTTAAPPSSPAVRATDSRAPASSPATARTGTALLPSVQVGQRQFLDSALKRRNATIFLWNWTCCLWCLWNCVSLVACVRCENAFALRTRHTHTSVLKTYFLLVVTCAAGRTKISWCKAWNDSASSMPAWNGAKIQFRIHWSENPNFQVWAPLTIILKDYCLEWVRM